MQFMDLYMLQLSNKLYPLIHSLVAAIQLVAKLCGDCNIVYPLQSLVSELTLAQCQRIQLCGRMAQSNT